MSYPRLSSRRSDRVVTDTFAGYDHNMKIPNGEWYDTKNLTAMRYPMFSPRPKRALLNDQFTKLHAIIAKNVLYWIDNGTLYANGYATGLTGLQTEEESQLVSMGAYICIFPDKKYINTMDLTDYGDMGAVWNYSGTVTYTMCHQDGTIYQNVSKGPTEPENPVNGQIWIDTASGTVKEFAVYTRIWVVVETVYTRVDFTTSGQVKSVFKEHDGVNITGMHEDESSDLNGCKILYAVGEENNHDFIVIIGIQEESFSEEAEIRISRDVPDMDFVCEAQNRLWGCFYGNLGPGKGNINEIYCCALGDFKNWEQYLGVSTDSWRASRGSDGPWTGCINYLGSPTFFKENIIHTVSVSPVGAHQIGDLPARGVQQGSHGSLAVVNETLYYKARSGIVAYQGGIPADVGQALGEEKYYNAVAGAFGDRYYISMKDAHETWHLFCYDVKKGIWMREDNLHAEGFAPLGDELYAKVGNSILALNGTDGAQEETVEWYAETGIQYYQQPDRKYLSRYNIRLNMERGSKMQIFFEYDSSGLWEFQQEVRLPVTGTAMIPVRPRRCDHLRMRLEGSGDVRIFSIARILELGSDA